MKTPKDQWQEFQEQSLQLLKTQQEAYLASIRAWRDQVNTAAAASSRGSVAAASGATSTVGQTSGASPFPAFPSVEEITEINQAYLRKINEQQQEFLRQLTAMSTEQP
jgi:hypothetical protein